MTEHTIRVAIVGGGIGGATAAIALARNGIEVTVLEQADEIPAVGASFQLGPNALRLTDALGLLPALRQIGVRPEAVEFRRWDDGSLLLHTDLGEPMEAHFGAPQLDFFRPDLHRVLAGALPPETLRLGVRVTAVEQDDDGVAVVVADGERLHADVAIAADGIRSPIRQQLVGADDPVFAGTVVYRGIVDYDRVADLHPDGVNRYWLGPHRHGVSYKVGEGRLLAFNLGVRRPEPAQESWTLETPAEEAAQYLEGWDPSLVERIRRCGVVLRGAVYVRRPLEHWSFVRITLLGDAAHAMEPFQAQGAAQSVEDAYVLAECVHAAGDDVEAALARYEQIRMARAAELQRTSRGAGDELYLPDGPEQRARDEGFLRLAQAQPWGTRQRIWEYDVRQDLEELALD
jgi:salicylate hydroxylase